MNRRSIPVAIAVLLAALGLATPASHATGIDPEVVAQAIAEDGYYIDSGASHLRSDAARDRLRSELERAKSPVFVAVIPAGTTLSPAQVYQLAKRKGTYAVLTGGTLRAASNTLPAARVRGAVAQAVRTHRGDPGAAVVAFVGLTNGTKRPVASAPRRATPTPSDGPTSAEPSAATSAAPRQTPAATAKEDSGGGTSPLLIAGLVLLVLAGGGAGYLVYRKQRGPRKTPV
jgi:hypothetical protein